MTTRPEISGGTGSDALPATRANRVQPFDRAAAGQSLEKPMPATKKPTRWERVLAWLNKKRKDTRKQKKTRTKPRQRSNADEKPVISLERLKAFWTEREPVFVAPKRSRRRPRVHFIPEQCKGNWARRQAEKKAKRKEAKFEAHAAKLGITPEELRQRIAARRAA